MRKCLCSQVCESCRAREALLRWWWPAKPNWSEPSLSYSSRSGHTDNEHWERKTEQCQQMNCILNCASAVCSYFSPQFLLLSLEAPSSARQAVWLWTQEPPAAIITHSLNTFKHTQFLQLKSTNIHLKNPSFLPGNFLNAVSQYAGVIYAQRGDTTHPGTPRTHKRHLNKLNFKCVVSSKYLKCPYYAISKAPNFVLESSTTGLHASSVKKPFIFSQYTLQIQSNLEQPKHMKCDFYKSVSSYISIAFLEIRISRGLCDFLSPHKQ